MVAGLIQGVAAAIRSAYAKSDFGVYTELVPAAAKLPCFGIFLKEQTVRPGLKNRFWEDNRVEVVYTPSGSSLAQVECRTAAVALGELLEFVSVDGLLVRGVKMESRIEGDRLFFGVTYRFWLEYAKEPDCLMQEARIYEREQEGEAVLEGAAAEE